jgi:hypothetical protein
MALTADEQKSSIDILAEGSLSDQLNESPIGNPEAKEPEIDEKEAAREARFAKIEQQNMELQQEAQFMRGYLQRQANEQQQRQPEPKDEPEPEIDYEAVSRDIEARGAKALHEFVDGQIERRIQKALKEVDGRVNGRINQDRALDGRRQAFANELNTCMTEFKDFWSDDNFKSEADAEAMKILQMRGGKLMQDFQPGDLYSAASRVAARWERAGKGQQPEPKTNGSGNSLREITRRVPNETLGNGSNGKRTTTPKSIDDLDMTDKEKAAARNVYRKLKDLNPDLPLSEERWVKSYLAGQREHEDAA